MLEEEIANFSKVGHILLTGDFNARTDLLPDYVTHDSDLYILLPPDYLVDTFIPRKSEDKTVNNYGKELLDLCIASQLRIVNGRIRPDGNRGALTCFTPRGTSVVDYVVDYAITSKSFLIYVSHFQVGDILPCSDHCPLYFNLLTGTGIFFRINKINMLSEMLFQDVLERMESMQQEEVDEDSGSPTFVNLSLEKLIEIFATHEFQSKVTSLKTELSTFPATECAHRFTRLLYEALNGEKKTKSKNKKSFPRNSLFDTPSID